jgi:hypothetical protein
VLRWTALPQEQVPASASPNRDAVSKMSDESDRRIPDDDIREAFDLAVTALIHWDREGGEEPKLTLNGEAYSISAVAVLAETFKEPMPASLFWRMVGYANRTLQRTVAAELSKDSSFQTSARCVVRWVKEIKSIFGR